MFITDFVGIDISAKRGCAIACIDELGRARHACWSKSEVGDVVQAVRALSRSGRRLLIGIDAPRMPVNSPRAWYWDRKAADWRPRQPDERGWGRHCEVIVSALKLAKPQWTPPKADAPEWMRLGFELFDALRQVGVVYEIFPTASYAQLQGAVTPRLGLSFEAFAGGPKDMLDAYVGAVTVREFVIGNGASIGGDDGLGAIVLPKKMCGNAPTRLFQWSSKHLAV